jgi:hypothetical protein
MDLEEIGWAASAGLIWLQIEKKWLAVVNMDIHLWVL